MKLTLSLLLLLKESSGAEATGSIVDGYAKCGSNDEALIQQCQVSKFL